MSWTPRSHKRQLAVALTHSQPPVFGPAWQTVYRRFAQWSRNRVWARLHRVIIDELGGRGQLDWSRCAIDSVSLLAAKGGH
jgi:hypothetical protein